MASKTPLPKGERCDKICRKSPVLLPGEPGLQAAQPGASCSFTCRSPPPTASNPGGKGAGLAREVFHFVFTARGQLFLSSDTSLSSPPPPARDSRRVKAPLLPGIPDVRGSRCIRRTASIVNLQGPYCPGVAQTNVWTEGRGACVGTGTGWPQVGAVNSACPCPPVSLVVCGRPGA